MMKETKVYFFIGGVVFILMLWLACSPAQATRYHNETTNITNIYPSETTIISGVSEDELASGLAASIAATGHQFDFGTYAFQASIVGAFDAGESADAVSFGLGKRFEDLDILFHGSYTRNDDQDWLVIGATWRF